MFSWASMTMLISSCGLFLPETPKVGMLEATEPPTLYLLPSTIVPTPEALQFEPSKGFLKFLCFAIDPMCLITTL